MNLLAGLAHALREQKLDLRVNVLDAFLDREFSFGDFAVYRLESALYGVQILFAEQPDRVQHAGVSQRAEHVGFGQVQVHFAVSSDRKALDLPVDVIAFLPQFHIFRIVFSVVRRMCRTASPGVRRLEVRPSHVQRVPAYLFPRTGTSVRDFHAPKPSRYAGRNLRRPPPADFRCGPPCPSLCEGATSCIGRERRFSYPLSVAMQAAKMRSEFSYKIAESIRIYKSIPSRISLRPTNSSALCDRALSPTPSFSDGMSSRAWSDVVGDP